MTATAKTSLDQGHRIGIIFGVPLGDFGLFSSLLLSFSLGFASFFLATFLAIFSLLFYNEGGHHNVDFADTYKFVGLPVGLVVLAVSLGLFGWLWIRRKVSGR
jgi:ABC-type dipeptide/oligopeptide/nickel transport system permease subunit